MENQVRVAEGATYVGYAGECEIIDHSRCGDTGCYLDLDAAVQPDEDNYGGLQDEDHDADEETKAHHRVVGNEPDKRG